MPLADQVRAARIEKGLTERDLDREGKFGYGFTKKVEAGTQGVGPKRLERLGQLLGVELTADPGPPPPPPPSPSGEVAPAPPGGLPPSEDATPARGRGLFGRFRRNREPLDPNAPAEPRPPRRSFFTPADPNRGRMSAADDFGDLFEWGAELIGPDHVPTSRMLAFESPIAGFMLDDAVNGTVVDRLAVQPIVKARGRFDLVFAVVLPPLLTLRIENAIRQLRYHEARGEAELAAHAAASANGGMRMLRSTLKRSFPLMAPAIKKARAREKESAAALSELLDAETMEALGVTMRDGVPVDANGKKVDAGDVMIQFLFADFTVQIPDEAGGGTDDTTTGAGSGATSPGNGAAAPGHDARGAGTASEHPGRSVDGASL